MSSHLPLGAIDKLIGSYIYPKLANKESEYCCPSCKKELILCKGTKRIPYFRHKYDDSDPCNHYNNPGESQIHKDAKQALKSALENKICCKGKESFTIPELGSTSKIVLEHIFNYRGLKKIADDAYLENNEILCIFEICYKHKTKKEDRPEPWFEIEALDLINKLNDTDTNNLEIDCIRSEKCEECITKEREKQNENRLKYYRYCNKYNQNTILVPYGYFGSIKEYPELVNKYIKQYLEIYESKENKLLYPNTEYYEYYKKTLFNFYKYSGSSMIESGGWNKKNIDLKKINELLKKDKLTNPITLFREMQIKILSERTICKKCNNEGYCICDLNNIEIELLKNNKCLICKGTGKYGFNNYDCVYCN